MMPNYGMGDPLFEHLNNETSYIYPDIYELVDFIFDYNVTEFIEIINYAEQFGLESWIDMLLNYKNGSFFSKLLSTVRQR